MICFPLFLGWPQEKDPNPNSVFSAGYKEVRVRPAMWDVWKGDFSLCFPFLLGIPGLTAPWGSWGCFCSCKCCLRHKVLSRNWKYFEFWFSKSALNLILFKRSFTCWVRNLFSFSILACQITEEDPSSFSLLFLLFKKFCLSLRTVLVWCFEEFWKQISYKKN